MKLLIVILCMAVAASAWVESEEAEALMKEENLLTELIRRIDVDEGIDKRRGPQKASTNQNNKQDTVEKIPANSDLSFSPINTCCDTRVVVADLYEGTTSSSDHNPNNINIEVDSESIGDKCSGSGFLNATFERITEDPCDLCMSEPFYGRRMLKVVLYLDPRPGYRGQWMYGLGDSISSNGYGGDGNTNKYDAEVDGVYPHINLYSNDACKEPEDSNRFMETIDNALAMGINEVTLYIANGYIRVVAGSIDKKICSSCLFGLNGQTDVNSSGNDVTNFDVFMRFNGVVNGRSDRTGYGVCRVHASWVCPNDCF